MPASQLDIAEVAELVVRARKRPNSNYFDILISYANAQTPLTAPSATMRVSGMRFRPDVQITFIDETGLLPDIKFNSAIPAKVMQQFVAVLTVFMNDKASFSASQLAKIQPILNVLSNAKAQGVGLKFIVDPTPEPDRLMAAELNGLNQPVVTAGYYQIRVHPTLVTNPSRWGNEIDVVLIHELLHLDPVFQQQSVDRFNRNARAGETYEYWHQYDFQNEAKKIRNILAGNVPPAFTQSEIQGQPGQTFITATSDFNLLVGLEAEHTFVTGGIVDFLWGGAFDSRFIWAENAGDVVIAASGGSNTLEIEGPYTIADVRIGEYHHSILIGVESGSATMSVYDLPRNVVIGLDTAGAPVVQTLEVGGQLYSLASLEPIYNGKPDFTSINIIRKMDLYFPGGRIATFDAHDADGDAVSYSVKQIVSGIGNTSQWWFEENILYTDYVHNARSGLTRGIITVTDGSADQDVAITVIWAGTRGST